jgi:hypothetical protein
MILCEPTVRRRRGALSSKASNSCSDVERRVRRIGRELAVGDSVEDNFARRRLGFRDGVLLRTPIQQGVQFRNFRDLAAVSFAVELNSELLSDKVTPRQSDSLD